jgi:hypothetical protein
MINSKRVKKGDCQVEKSNAMAATASLLLWNVMAFLWVPLWNFREADLVGEPLGERDKSWRWKKRVSMEPQKWSFLVVNYYKWFIIGFVGGSIVFIWLGWQVITEEKSWLLQTCESEMIGILYNLHA